MRLIGDAVHSHLTESVESIFEVVYIETPPIKKRSTPGWALRTDRGDVAWLTLGGTDTNHEFLFDAVVRLTGPPEWTRLTEWKSMPVSEIVRRLYYLDTIRGLGYLNEGSMPTGLPLLTPHLLKREKK